MANNWKNIEDEKPGLGMQVLFWHPVYEIQLGFYGRNGFYRTFNGQTEEFQNIDYWQKIPDSPDYIEKSD